MKERIQNYSEWIAKKPDQSQANNMIHETVVSVMSPKFKKKDYRNNAYSSGTHQTQTSITGLNISPSLRLWDEHRIGIIDHHDSEETSALAQLYLSYINTIIRPLGVNFNDSYELKTFVKNMNFHNGRHYFGIGGTDILIFEREYNPHHHVAPLHNDNK
jgi:hypothetical protein